MLSLTLTEIATTVGGTLFPRGVAEPDTRVSGPVETDSREIVPGGIFVAKPGEVTDGHLFAPAAVEAGAALLLVERELDLDVPQIVVPDVVLALGALATEIIAVTGSNGKTTTKNLLNAIFSAVGETVAPIASFNNEVGAPLTMLKLTESTRYLVAEMGASAPGEIRRLVRMAKPDVGIVLTVGLAHAGEFGGIETTLKTKTEMVADLLPEDTAVLNRDDARVASMADKTAARVLFFGRDESAAVRATDVEATASGTTFTLHLPTGESSPVSFRVLGEHHVTNALAATAAATTLAVPLDTIVSALESVQRAERWRMEILDAGGVTVINDAYNASPDSMAAALKTLAQVAAPGQRTVAVLGEMSELGEFAEEEHDRVGLLAVRLNIKQIVVVGQGARRLHLQAIAQGSWDGESVFVENQDEAFQLLRQRLRPGDLVLVKSSNSAGLRFLGDRLGEVESW
jgi:UDP-N-acetylmuramoyl-tripeptide--D-alanyl-D-alanine ligase